MIPMRVYPEDDYHEFVAELLEAWEDREAPSDEKTSPRLPQPEDRIVERR